MITLVLVLLHSIEKRSKTDGGLVNVLPYLGQMCGLGPIRVFEGQHENHYGTV